MIAPCTCQHKDQDAIHGPGRRVYNIGKTQAKCTVCGKTITVTVQQAKDSRGKKSN